MRIPTMRMLTEVGSFLRQSSHTRRHTSRMFSLLSGALSGAGRVLKSSGMSVCFHYLHDGRYSAFPRDLRKVAAQQYGCKSCLSLRSYSEGPPKKTIFSGIQPTGVLHLGNYFGAVRKWVELQNAGENVIYCIVDLHSITLPQDPKTLHSQILSMAASLIACGIDPTKAILYQQSSVSEHSQLNWILGCLTSMARLNYLPQFKEKSESLKEIPLGIYVYPVLQSADILLFRATHVPVGNDQRQHIQLASHLAKVFNHKFGHTFELPRKMIYDDPTSRIRSLRQPTKKMSKSEADPKSRIEITDSPEVITEKFKKAVTDFTSAVYYDEENRPGVSNIMAIHSAFTGKSYDEITAECAGMESSKYKLLVADVVVEHLRPIRLAYNELLSDRAHLNSVLEKGSARAREIAHATLQEVKLKVGLSG